MTSIRRTITKFSISVIILVFASLLFVACGGETTTEAPTTETPTTESVTEEQTTIPEEIMVESITVEGFDGLSEISTFHGTLQMTASILPSNADDKSVVWSVNNDTGEATINETGFLTAVANGTVIVRATSVSTPSISGSQVIIISNQDVLVSSISVTGANDLSSISTFQGTLQMEALVLPDNADDPSILWTVENGTGEATISQAGLLTAVENGTVIVKATSASTPSIFGTMNITISNQEVLVSSISVTGAEDSSTISTFEGTLQMEALVLPENADDPSILWTVENGTGEATINQAGLLTAVENGTVTVKATSVSTPSVSGTREITISNQEVMVSSITVSGADDASSITIFEGTLQMVAVVTPSNAENPSVDWSVTNGTGEATIDQAGLLTAVSNGTVIVEATSVSSPTISGTKEITISNQEVLLTSVVVSGTNDIEIIDVTSGTLQMLAAVLPNNATDKSVVWTVDNGTGMATINETGLLTAVANGTVTVTARSASTPMISGSLLITISNQAVVGQIANVNLGTAGDFVILSKAGISTTGTTLITGNIGVSPLSATYITGFDLILDTTTEFSTSSLVIGKVYAADYSTPTPAYLTTAVSDMETAYLDAAGRAANYNELYAGDISGRTLYKGVYNYGTDLLINTDVILSGSSTDVFIFQVDGKLTVANGVSIILQGGLLAENIIWQVAGTVAIGVGAEFSGTILAQTNITLATSATVVGKLYAQTEVTLDANTVGE